MVQRAEQSHRTDPSRMKLRDPALLSAHLADRDITQAQLGRKVNMTRQMIWALIHNDRGSCTAEKAQLIERALDVVPGTLFVPHEAEATASSRQPRTKVTV